MKIAINEKINKVSFICTKLGLPNVSLMFPFLYNEIENGV